MVLNVFLIGLTFGLFGMVIGVLKNTKTLKSDIDYLRGLNDSLELQIEKGV